MAASRVYLALLLICHLTCSDAATSYGAVIDAGSSGSRLSLFSWPSRSFQGLPNLTTPVEVVFVSIRGVAGIDTPAGRAILPELLALAKEKLNGVGVFEYSQVPLFLKATAGMRILSVALRTSIMAEVSATLAASGFMFKQGWARTISGEEEGISGFISVNYMAKTLPGMAGGTSGATMGALDLGGASTQITFQPPPGVDIMSNQFDLRLSPTSQLSVYTHSFLYMGQNEAVRRINELVVQNHTTNEGRPYVPGTLIPHPCYLKGTPQFLISFFTPSVEGGVVNFTGTGNASACAAFVAPLLLQGAQCLTDPIPTPLPTPPGRLLGASSSIPPLPPINPNSPGSTCSINGQYQPPINVSAVKFMAFSSFSFIYNSLGVGLSAPLSELAAQTAAFCGTNFADATAAFPNSNVPNQQHRYCILGTYASQLLINGYKIDPNTPGVVNVAASSGTTPVSWALGNILYEANALPWSVECGSSEGGGGGGGGGGTPPSTIALAVVLAGILAVGGGYLVWQWYLSRAASASTGSSSGCFSSSGGGGGGGFGTSVGGGGSGGGGSGKSFQRPAWDREGSSSSSKDSSVITANPL